MVADRLRNPEIADRLVVSVRTVESHIAALLRKLDVRDRSALTDIGLRVRSERTDVALALPMDSFVGRERELVELEPIIGGSRLVTLTGPGGVGKTRLAMHLVALQRVHFADGHRFADLAPLRDPDQVGETVAIALGVHQQPDQPLGTVLATAARDLHALLLLDNCEHLLPRVAEQVRSLLSLIPRLTVVTTSREPLEVPGEIVYRIPPLGLQVEPGNATAPSVRLFADRAQAAASGFTLTADNIQEVTRLCQQLDGLPLAIELAAARVPTFTVAELLTRIDRRFDLLSRGPSTTPPRHRALSAMVDWSYSLLTVDEQRLFSRLAVFSGSFEFDAAEQVCADAALPADTVLESFPRLVDKSLLMRLGGQQSRFRLLETLHAYASRMLQAQPDQWPAIQRRHASYCLELAEKGSVGLRGPDQAQWLQRLPLEMADLHRGLAHWIEHRDQILAYRFLAAMAPIWDLTGRRRDGQRWVDAVLELGDPPVHASAVRALCEASRLFATTDQQRSIVLAELAYERSQLIDDSAIQAHGLNALGWRYGYSDDHIRAVGLLRRSAELFPAAEKWARGFVMTGITIASADIDEVITAAAEAQRLFCDVGDRIWQANSLFIAAWRAMEQQILTDTVGGWLSQSLELGREAGDDHAIAHAELGLARLQHGDGDPHTAKRLLASCHPTLRRLGDLRCLGRALYLYGGSTLQEGDDVEAERLLSDSVEAASPARDPVTVVEALTDLARLAATSGRLHRAAVLLGHAWAAGEGSFRITPWPSTPQAELVSQLRTSLGSQACDDAIATGRGADVSVALRTT